MFHIADPKDIKAGKLDENQILNLNPVVDAYGVGTAITKRKYVLKQLPHFDL